MSHTNLSDSDLSGADLSRATMDNANLSGAYLGDSDLRSANLNNANLGNANLSSADLKGATLINLNSMIDFIFNSRTNMEKISLLDLDITKIPDELRNRYEKTFIIYKQADYPMTTKTTPFLAASNLNLNTNKPE